MYCKMISDLDEKTNSGTELEFLNNLWGPGTELEYGCRTGPPGYIGCRYWFPGIDSWAP
jgi:hypothetical protein